LAFGGDVVIRNSAFSIGHSADRPEIVTDVLRWRIRPDALELAVSLEDVFRDV
jgi:hypothetical protein